MAQLSNIFGGNTGYFPGSVSGGTSTPRTDNPGDGSTGCLSLVGTSGSAEVTWSSSGTYTLDSTHTYYFSAKVYYPDSVNGSFDFYWPISEPCSLSGQTVTVAKAWKRISGVFTRTDFASGAYQCRFDYNNQSGTVAAYVSGMTLVDLTAAFGSGSEPDKDWCDTVIPYITTSGFYSTLTDLFGATADSIRKANSSSEKVFPSQFPDLIQNISTRTVSLENYNITVPVTTSTLPTAFTPTCFYYYGGYYWVAGSNSSGEGIICYSSDGSNWTAQTVASGAAYYIKALTIDTANSIVFAFCDTSSYGGRSVLKLTNFFSGMKLSTYWTSAHNYTDAVSVNDSGWALCGETVTSKTSSGSLSNFNHTSLNHALYRCCAYNEYPIGISYDGYYTYKNSITDTGVAGDLKIADGFTSKAVAQMGDYLVVAGTKTDGTYWYCAKGTPGALTFTAIKVLDSTVTPIGLAYAGGLYMMAYMDGANLRFLATKSITGGDSNVSVKVSALNGMTGVEALGNGSKLFAVADNSGSAVMASYSVS
jgi:hypothetical protein